MRSGALNRSNFYPRPPRGGRHETAEKQLNIAIFLSTPSARRATESFQKFFGCRGISIHALREEGDDFWLP